MFTKYTIALAALLLIGGSSVAGAYEDPESKIGDRYPTLEEGYRPVAPRYIGAGSQTSKLNQDIEDPESKTGDRYPTLDASFQSAAANRVAMRMRVPQTAKLNQDIEDPEAKIADRYPALAQPSQFARSGGAAMAQRSTSPNAVVATKKPGHRS